MTSSQPRAFNRFKDLFSRCLFWINIFQRKKKKKNQKVKKKDKKYVFILFSLVVAKHFHFKHDFHVGLGMEAGCRVGERWMYDVHA